MLAWRAANPKDKYGRHPYDGDQFGITDGVLAHCFRAYRHRFGPLLG